MSGVPESLASALAWWWQARSHLREGREHLTAALASTTAEPPRSSRARALTGVANVFAWQGDSQNALDRLEDAIQVWRHLGEPAELGVAIEGKFDQSLALYRRSLLVARTLGDLLEMSFEVQGVAMSLSGLGRHAASLRLQAAARAEWGAHRRGSAEGETVAT